MKIDRNIIIKEVNYTYQCCKQILGFKPSILPKDIIPDFIELAKNTHPILPGERGIVTLLKPKTASLLSDKVWLQYPGEDLRLDFTFGWQTPMAIRLGALLAFMRSYSLNETDDLTKIDEAYKNPNKNVSEFLSFTEGDLAKEYSQFGAYVTPLYNSVICRDNDYRSGNLPVIISVIEDVTMVSEATLTWEQVIEFRNDKDANYSYRSFVHWLDKEMIGKSLNYIIDEVNQRMEAYKWALKKHGIQTVIGTLENTIDAKSIFGSAIASFTLDSLSKQPIMSLLGGASILIGKAAIHIATRMIERKDITNKSNEIAFVHEIKKLDNQK